MRRQFLLASAGAMAFAGSVALAADLPISPPPPPAPVFTWTGIYLGGQIGFAWGNGGVGTFAAAGPSDVFTASFDGSAQGVIGGAHVGYNYQINQWVLGLEGSVDGTSLEKTVTGIGSDFFGNTDALSFSTRSGIQGSIRARAGFAWDRLLIYATGGVAFAGFDSGITDVGGFITNGFQDATANFSNTRVGWTAGGGIEYAMTNSWSVRVEYRYSGFGNIMNAPFAGLVAPGVIATSRRQLNENQLQGGLSYKFDTNAPALVAARY